jgi:preprotein translocase subunit SecA
MVAGIMDEYGRSQKQDPNAAFKEVSAQLRDKFGYQLTLDPGGAEAKNPEFLEKRICSDLEKDISDKEALIGLPYLNAIIRDNYLLAVDRKWLDHLENMEALREAVYLRHYAQKNPLTEYKVEGFQIFDRMIDEIRQEIASRLHLIRIQIAGDAQSRRSVSRSLATSQSASHSSICSFGASSFGSSASNSPHSDGRVEGATVVRTHPKVGRNDPCPCGSGKKYKHCHGRN